METLQIQYGVQGNGMTFTLGWSDYKRIKEMFPNAQPAKSIFVEYDWRVDFEHNHAHLEKYVFPALFGSRMKPSLNNLKPLNL
jgi:hypothetical protein